MRLKPLKGFFSLWFLIGISVDFFNWEGKGGLRNVWFGVPEVQDEELASSSAAPTALLLKSGMPRNPEPQVQTAGCLTRRHISDAGVGISTQASTLKRGTIDFWS